jgi:hypothetical protein
MRTVPFLALSGRGGRKKGSKFFSGRADRKKDWVFTLFCVEYGYAQIAGMPVSGGRGAQRSRFGF